MVKEFMGKDFLLNNEPAIKMFEAADKMPIFDWHCHLSPKEIYENKQPSDIAWLWLQATIINGAQCVHAVLKKNT